MEYVFGTKGTDETLRTKAPAHTHLTGWQQLARTVGGETITDRFRVVQKTDSKEDAAGNCYDWYLITDHYRTTDRTAPLARREARNGAMIDYLAMMLGIALPSTETEEEEPAHE